MKQICVYTDGGSRGNPGPAALGVYIIDTDGEVLWQQGRCLGITTNNVAEYSAVLEAHTWLLEHEEILKEYSKVLFFMDSELVCRQLTGIYKVKNETLRSLLYSIREKEKHLSLPFSYAHVRREKNTQADRMVNLALDNPS